jgi:hypothetical protein
MPKECCENCKFCFNGSYTEEYKDRTLHYWGYVCRRMPPTRVGVVPVDGTNWCGEHKPRDLKWDAEE